MHTNGCTVLSILESDAFDVIHSHLTTVDQFKLLTMCRAFLTNPSLILWTSQHIEMVLQKHRSCFRRKGCAVCASVVIYARIKELQCDSVARPPCASVVVWHDLNCNRVFGALSEHAPAALDVSKRQLIHWCAWTAPGGSHHANSSDLVYRRPELF